MIQRTPPMGWNSWNTFGLNINDRLLYESADTMVRTGLRDRGYTYIVMDDGWSMKQRDAQHRLVPDPVKFPHGIKPVADYMHERGLKLGIYSCAGVMTCGQYPGSFEHEFIDAESFASWGVDFLKYDYCFKPRDEVGALLYRRMGAALANCGRDIVFNACSWGVDNTADWIKSTGAHMWRSTVDIMDTWESIKSLSKRQKELFRFNGQGCFKDMDMLVVGMGGKGNVGLKGCTFEEYRSHFSMWALCGSPLFIGCDIRTMSDETLSILENPDVIAIDQDAAYRQPFLTGGCHGFVGDYEDDCFVLARMLENGDFAIGMFNMADERNNLYFTMAGLGLNRSCGKKLQLKSLWTGETGHTTDGYFAASIPAHDCLLLRASLADEEA